MVIAVIALLAGIALPALASARSKAGMTKSLANLHSLAVTFQLYHEQYKAYPYIDDAQQLLFTPPDQTPSLKVGISPQWDIERYWPCVMHDIAPWRENYRTWISPGLDRDMSRPWLAPGSPPAASGTTIDPSYRYSNSFVASSDTWTPGASTTPKAGAQRADMVTSPSSKVLLLDQDSVFAQRAQRLAPADPRPVLFADASASAVPDSRALSPSANRLRSSYSPRVYHDTTDGVRGRDR